MARGDIVTVELPAALGQGGHEQAGQRPAIVVQTDVMHQNLSTTMVVPLTSNLKALSDAFKRYIPLTPPISTVTTGQVNNISNLGQKQSVTKNNDVTDGKQRNLLKLHDCHGVTVEKGGMGEGNRKIEKCHGCGAHSALGQQLYCLG